MRRQKETWKKIKLLFIVPYPELKEKVEFVIANHPDREKVDADIRVMTVDETSVEIDSSLYDAIIARGYTARKMMSIADRIPVIALEISGYDIVRAVAECRERINPKKIAIFGSQRTFYEAEYICRLFGCQGKAYAEEDHGKLEGAVIRAKAEGCDAVIGGYAANLCAEKAGLPAVIVRTGEETIQQAMNEAVRTVERVRQERIIAQMYKTIIYSSKEGILYVDAGGNIQVRNRVIREMAGNISLMDKPLKKAIPLLYEGFQESVSTGQEISGKIYTFSKTKTTISAEFIPVVVGDEISGVVINVSDITKIQELEGRIRRKLSEKGLSAKYTFEDVVHESKIMEDTIEEAKQYAASDANISIVGETGTGKELFAQSIHNASPRKDGPFVAINCAALPENLLETELFGYVEGAFTGTSKGGKMGLFEQAHGGTLFLDEIGEISPAIQTKLLRVLQEKEVRRIGDNKVISVNVRIISATNKNLRRLVDKGSFRRDLMYRLDVLRLFLPPLRKRDKDGWLIFCRLLEEETGPMPELSEEARMLFQKYPFKGNIRELKNAAERALVLYPGRRITGMDMEKILYPQDVGEEDVEDVDTDPYEGFERDAEERNRFSGRRAEGSKKQKAPAVGERELILWGLEQSGGNQTKAALLLGMDRTTLWRKRKKYGI